MNAIETTWKQDRGMINSATRGFLLSITAAFVLSMEFIVSQGLIDRGFLVFSVGALYVAACAYAVRRRCKIIKHGHYLRVRECELVVPRFMFQNYVIRFSEINSLEMYPAAKSGRALLIGRNGKSPVVVESRFFETPDMFDDFIGLLPPPRNRVGRSQQSVSLPLKRPVRYSLPSTFIALALFGSYMIVAESNYSSITERALLQGGLISGSAIKADQVYRFASSFFLHINPLHLLVNIFSLVVIGHYVEALFGRVRLVVLLVGAAISGSLVSTIFSTSDMVVGASGGIYGAFGAYLVASIRLPDQIPGSVAIPIKHLVALLMLQLLLDATSARLSMASHVGGLIFGFCYARYMIANCATLEHLAPNKIEYVLGFFAVLLYLIGALFFFMQYLR